MSDRSNSAALDYDELEDQRDLLDLMLARVESANDELRPGAMVHRISDGANPIAEYRKFRGMTIAALAQKAGLSEADVVSLEEGTAEPGIRVTARIAQALRVELDALVPWAQD